ncbi:unnamed protein product, partial [Mesorhabditis belari]|uniref:SAM domain-containing protein n=1 Tax=Mesorhabditis belari TaxID=2138241 RepID=A0AAF3J4K2_9BILA
MGSEAEVDSWSLREEAVAGVEGVVDLLEDHFGFPVARSPQSGGGMESKKHSTVGLPAPALFTFDTKGDEPDKWRYVINSMRQTLAREEAVIKEERRKSLEGEARKRSRWTSWLSNKWRRRKRPKSPVSTWTVDGVLNWLSSLGLSQYTEQFRANDITGQELIHLERSDFKDLGVIKIGHIKRLQSAIGDLVEKENEARTRAGSRKGASLSVERRGMA